MKIRYILMLITTWILFTTAESYSVPQSAKNIADVYGIGEFKKVVKVSYTFNVHINGKDIQRKWIWYPKTGHVVFVNDNAKYRRSSITDELKNTDHKFINDNYWLLFPFHLIWDDDVEFIESTSKQSSPINKESLNKLTVKYVNDAGYTPNDIYELYYDDDYIIKEWVFRPGGSAENRRAMT
ncbi:MAG: hypothetical protein GWO07_02945 [Candidatus Dadabacteria bacterium]|nr:hypothetical protein [Candidatus Dadabacteria bacterium]NIS07724.1 hypothetical protein [Candidatus Dadabacteria bacterium]NIV42329.1 hypothetical protein [Candidatus Dadabacteria bacterium]NIY21365.1 hypothetical protein [Candidatus Dadabacteria bacterium]